MSSARALRLDRGWTFAELALATGISARALAEFEYGLQSLDRDSLLRLAQALGVAPGLLVPVLRATAGPAGPARPADVRPLVLAGLVGLAVASAVRPQNAALLASLVQPAPGAAPSPSAAARAGAALVPILERAEATPTVPAPTPTPSATATPTATPTPTFAMLPDGPHGCPLSTAGRIVITQGFAVGTHLPARTMGAVDLAVDRDGDGVPEPDTTAGTLVVATLGGRARVFPNSWPGGNFIIITDPASGWGTAYGHLATLAVADGQQVKAGTPLGTVGSTGMASGPHLHYEVRSPAGNIDPAPLLGCGS